MAVNNFEFNKKQIHIFSDFDGTVTKIDLGDQIFKEFGEFEPHHTNLINKVIDIKEYWHNLCHSLKKDVDQKTIAEYALKQEIDPYFKQFAIFCKDNGIPLSIVSDGFDAYIKPILKRESLEWLPVYSNRLLFETDVIQPVFPGATESCKCFAASCKRNSVINQVPEDKIIIFIGDGYSDYCAAEHSDVIFAKKNLAAYCNENRLPHYPFKNFFDIKRLLINIMDKQKLKVRHQAMLKRKKAYEVE